MDIAFINSYIYTKYTIKPKIHIFKFQLGVAEQILENMCMLEY